MTVPTEDRDRVRDDYTDEDGNLTVDDVSDDLRDADFEEDSAQKFAEAIAEEDDLARSQRALNQAQQQAIESLSDGGAVDQEIVRAEDGFTAIGAPQNVEQRIERTGPTTGDVIAQNQDTGTEGKIGEVDLVPPTAGAQ